MERNTILAVMLACLVVFVYGTIFQSPKHSPALTNSQTTGNNIDTSNYPASQAINTEITKQSTSEQIKTEIYKLSTTKSDISYTNVGGSLHNIDFLGNKPFPLTDILAINGLNNVPFQEQKFGENGIQLTYQDKNWQITKTFENVDSTLIKARVDIKNLSEMSNLEDLSFTAFEIDQSNMDVNRNSRDSALYEYSVLANGKIYRKGNAYKFNDKNNKSENVKITWAGFRDHYNAVVVKPEFETKSYEIKADSDNQLNLTIQPTPKTLAAGEVVSYNFTIYSGPQNPWKMKDYGQGFEKIVAFSNFVIIEWIAEAIYHILPFFHGVFHSWGVAIILVSLLIYGLTYPLTMQSMMSMKKMQEVQPKMSALRERYKDDPQRLNMEMMDIYRREKINPFGGCLPFLIQMPFFMSLYQILWRAQYFQGQGFLWIKDLTQPDRLMILPFSLPFFGNELNILPVVTGGLMFLQQRVASKNVVVTDEQQATQQKMMMYILPVMMTCMFYKFASSWALYFFVFYTLSTITQMRISQAKAKK